MRWKQTPLIGALMLAAACGDDATGPNPASVAGQYVVGSTRGEFLYTENGTTWDLVEEGATIELHLFQNGTTAGRIFVPASSDTGEDYDADLAGFWIFRNDSVFVSQSAPTIISSMGLLADGDQLRGEQQFGSSHVKVTLVR